MEQCVPPLSGVNTERTADGQLPRRRKGIKTPPRPACGNIPIETANVAPADLSQQTGLMCRKASRACEKTQANTKACFGLFFMTGRNIMLALRDYAGHSARLKPNKQTSSSSTGSSGALPSAFTGKTIAGGSHVFSSS